MPAATPTSDRSEARLALLRAFAEAWRARDVERLMTFMADNCEFRASVGPEPGRTYRGRNEVRRGFAEILAFDQAGEGSSGVTLLEGDWAASQWELVRREAIGSQTVMKGCDFFAFSGDLIRLKDAYRKVHADLGS